jgi:hypothetical protein
MSQFYDILQTCLFLLSDSMMYALPEPIIHPISEYDDISTQIWKHSRATFQYRLIRLYRMDHRLVCIFRLIEKHLYATFDPRSPLGSDVSRIELGVGVEEHDHGCKRLGEGGNEFCVVERDHFIVWRIAADDIGCWIIV